MANPNINTHIPITIVGTLSGNAPAVFNYVETQGKSFLNGTPVSLSSGAIIAWSGTPALNSAGASANLITGVCLVGGLNYSVTGASVSPLFGSIGFPGGTPTFGTVPNQSSAVNLLHGSLLANGLTLTAQAAPDTVFEAMIDASGGGVYNLTTSNIGQQFGLTVDSSGYWYIDTNKTTVGTNTVLTILSLEPQDFVAGSVTTGITNGRARFRFNPLNTNIGM